MSVSSPRIEGFLIDDENEAKFAAHGITSMQVVQVLESEYLRIRNRRRRRGLYLILGRDYSGVCIASPIEATHDPAIWRPITAWPCKGSERERLERSA